MLCLHLLQICLVYVNTLLIQGVLAAPEWAARLTVDDLRALSPLLYSNVNPYGVIRLDMGYDSAPPAGGGRGVAGGAG
jgi:hypothetical protein